MTTPQDHPGHRLRCEARATGCPSHEFPTPDEEAARAMCDAHGWELIRIYAPGSHADRPAAAPAAGDPPLTSRQLKCLVTEARRTFDMLSNMGNITGTFNAWRRATVQQAVRREGLSHCQNRHYRKLLSVFRALRGAADPGGQATGRQSREGADTAERREQLLILLARELASHAGRVLQPAAGQEVLAAHAVAKGGPLTEAYLLTIARAKNPGLTLVDSGCLLLLTAARLEQLLFTLRNRIASREGRGAPAKRNKKQKGDS